MFLFSVKLSIAWGLRWDDVWTGGIMLQYWAALCWVMYQTHWMTAYHSLHLLYNWFYSHIIIFVSIINMRTRINVRGHWIALLRNEISAEAITLQQFESCYNNKSLVQDCHNWMSNRKTRVIYMPLDVLPNELGASTVVLKVWFWDRL